MPRSTGLLLVVVACAGTVVPAAGADVVTDWDQVACQLVAAAKISTPVANRALALTQTAVYEAVNDITGKYPSGRARDADASKASVEAAVAAASRAALSATLPTQQAAIDEAYRKALADIADGDARQAGIAIGERAAARVLVARRDDGADRAESYRPATTPGVYVPTTIPAVPQWRQRTPWLLSSPSQFRPAPPPALTSETWARDYAEIKAVGAKASATRTPEQTEIATFWSATLPSIYHGVVRVVAEQPNRDVTRNARLLMAVTQGLDDALIAVMDAKYEYGFWRPITAIRNGDRDGNDATERDASWTPFIETPMHPEYPCAHCILAATVGTILEAESGEDPLPELSTTSYMLEGVTRRWKTADDFIQEVSNARIYDGVHYRNSSEVGAAMGRKVGELAAKTHFATQ